MNEKFVAHVNVATPRFPRGDARIQPFFDGVAAINALAEASPGFVWRLDAADEEAKAEVLFGEPGLVIALSVWESVQALEAFVYRSAHGEYLRQRASWFLPRSGANKALWWVALDTRPTITEAQHRLEWLTLNGPGDVAFGFSQGRRQETEA